MSQLQDPNWVSLPIAKFSHSTLPTGARNLTWNHIEARNDIDFVVRDVKVVDLQGNCANRLVMKITAGTEILETQDLGELVKFARGFHQSSVAERPVQVVIKSPFLAIRYPKHANQVQRIQLRFHTAEDFNKAMQIMKDLGLPITESPRSSTSSSGQSASPAPSLLSSVSASSSATLGRCLPRPSSIQDSSHNFGPRLPSPLRSEFKALPVLNTVSLEARRPSSAQPFLITPVIKPSSSTILASPLTSSSFNNGLRQWPSLYESQVERLSTGRRLSYPFPQSSIGDDTATSSNHSLLVTQMHAQRPSEATTGQFTDRLSASSPFFSLHEEPVRAIQSSAVVGPFLSDRELLPNLHGPGISNKLASGTVANFHDLIPPPKRELPFPKPRATSTSRSSSASELPAPTKPALTPGLFKRANSSLGQPNMVAVKAVLAATPNPSKKRVAQRKAAVSKVAQEESRVEGPSADLVKDGLISAGLAEQEELSPLAAKSAAAIRPASAASRLQSKATTTKKRVATSAPILPPSAIKRPKMVDQGTQTQTLSGREHTITMRPTTSPDVVDRSAVDVPQTSPPEKYLDMLDAFVTNHKARPAPNELWEAPGYAGADEEERHLLLNDFICENLENRDFIQLCQDTEQAWRRIGLGL